MEPMNVTTAPDYALLRDGGQVLIRSYAPDDRAAIQALFERLSMQSRMMRFHSAATHLVGDAVGRLAAGHALVAELDGKIVALANYVPLRDPTRAEMAIAVDDAQHGRGIGTVLFEHLSADARRAGVGRFLAIVMAG